MLVRRNYAPTQRSSDLSASRRASGRRWTAGRARPLLDPSSGKKRGVRRDILPLLVSSRNGGISRRNPRFFPEDRSEEHTSELHPRPHLVCGLLPDKKAV